MADKSRNTKSKSVNMKVASKRKLPKGKKSDPAFAHILELAKALQAIYKQSYELQRPIVDDLCTNKNNVSEDELEHCFDGVLDISCTDYGMKLFNRLCKAFQTRYPECVAAYIKIQKEVYEDD